jgi:hypothetical protein
MAQGSGCDTHFVEGSGRAMIPTAFFDLRRGYYAPKIELLIATGACIAAVVGGL